MPGGPGPQEGGVPGDGMGQRAVRGAVVTVSAQGLKMVIQFLSVVILARLLTPQDYGLVAMVMAVIGVADIFRDFGLSSSAIQAPTLSRDEQVNLFWINTLLGLTLAVIAVASAPLVALLYQHPELRVITMALAVNFLINGMSTQYRADLNRRLLFRRLALADVLGPACGLALATVLALVGVGFWALVAQQVMQATVVLVVLGLGARWLPGRYRRGVPVRRFLSFGVRLVGSQLIAYIGSNIDTVMLGLRSTAGALGVYNRTYQLVMTPVGQIRGPLNTVAIPVLARMQDQDERFQSTVARGQVAMGYTLVAGLAVMAGAAAPLVSVVLGEAWLQAIPVLRLLAIGAGLQTLAYVGYWVYVTKGLVDHLFHYTFISTGIRVVMVVIGSGFGLVGVAAAMAVAPAVAWPLSIWWLSRRAAIPVRRLWAGGVRVLLFGAVVGVAAHAGVVLAARLPWSWAGGPWPELVLALLCATLTFVAAATLVRPFRTDVRDVLALVRIGLRR